MRGGLNLAGSQLTRGGGAGMVISSGVGSTWQVEGRGRRIISALRLVRNGWVCPVASTAARLLACALWVVLSPMLADDLANAGCWAHSSSLALTVCACVSRMPVPTCCTPTLCRWWHVHKPAGGTHARQPPPCAAAAAAAAAVLPRLLPALPQRGRQPGGWVRACVYVHVGVPAAQVHMR